MFTEFTEDDLLKLSDFFGLLSESTRLKIILELIGGEKNVSQISKNLNMSQSAVSYQLRILRQGRIVKFRKSGKNVFYSIDDEHVEGIINKAIEHLKHK
ncbi:metalloregulator ArsR/SmtB family transcription factor [Fervidobacterium sp. 2310opik-2]|uniref:ArsR/SmtB family transcription factor n=1 Tax=Fervidobacterium sp. 2310opik-2 TaxID=1755815 RepID=UPI0013E094C1|nr:metalloregulator ArsR/SmtB family transcription factor [Fervidobacterium sp. 2310opik-2]KAF2961702.1 ArsR family transcriptional regulator [Fervidobacterium sp. 2310opik-2]HOJ94258.1 metalloregulator ArsR/SmtB family transcription factor [Fervidobacterium nodosum]